jgi:hypothetical protein
VSTLELMNLKCDILVSKFAFKCNSYRYILALSKLANTDAGYLVLIHGGPRAAIDCMRLYLHNVDITYASFKAGLALFTTLFCSQNTNR